ncbi:MAG: TlpA family protein disulfide reductase [Burkholderiaceae bacterium]|jgi:thiol-disulfide isomerase/thioredoxin|nr:TlpA family protein disulfide reductase [Burkholderiaceae bacterium]
MRPDRKLSARRRLLLAALPLLAATVPGKAADAPVRWTDIALVDGRVLKAADLQKRTVVVQMWASWCPFCMKQNPHIQKLHEASRGGGLLVLTFTLDKTPQAAREYMDKRGYTFAAALTTPQVEAWFGKRRTLPEVYVVDPAGRIVFREDGEMFPEDIAALTRFAAR